ncbi:hypothetical protein [Pararhizobium sp. IMCC21322]|uniref:hypothetical protein n=1 Tax=Pararhizobium sp. IMCC21322 TaxID=3067903 RepID=UPI0027410422|nr:hypothetical protein [Pararhizobium sp. IMCC21322]
MNTLSVVIICVFALAIILAIFGAFKFFRHLPAYLRVRTGSSVAVHRFRFQDYVDWLAADNKTDGNGLLLFAAGMALSLMAFPFLLVF